jgi:hypothetical protein
MEAISAVSGKFCGSKLKFVPLIIEKQKITTKQTFDCTVKARERKKKKRLKFFNVPACAVSREIRRTK